MTSRIIQLNRQPIIVRRRWFIATDGTIGVTSPAALCAPPPPSGTTPTGPLLQAPCASTTAARATMFDAIGESLLGEEFTDLYDLTWVQ